LQQKSQESWLTAGDLPGWSDGAGDEAVAYFLAAMVLEPVFT
jgi:hypothetical protein